MRFSPIHLLLLSISLAQANEALDVLEGKVDAMSIVLPPREVSSDAEADDGEVPAGEIIYLEPEWAASPLDLLWSRSVLYDSSSNPWVQQIAVSGFFDFQASFGEAETETNTGPPRTAARNTDLDGTRSRRARLGTRIRAFNNTEIEAVGEFAGDSNYRGVERLKAYTQITDTTGITYGKFRPNMGVESRVEPQVSPFQNRTALANMVAPPASIGVSLHHAGEKYDYDLGWFSSEYDADLGGPTGDGMLNLSISRTSYEKTGDTVSRNRWHADYIHNFAAGDSNPYGYDLTGRRAANGNQVIVQNPAYRHLFSTGIRIDSERTSFMSDFQIAKGDTTVWGVSVGGTYWLIPGTLNLVGRYQYAGTDDAQGIVTALGTSGDLRFDSSPFFTGDELHSFYLGANLHLYKDSFVLQNGLEYTILNDEAGQNFNTEALIWQSGAKISF